jgi:hypothetical protein
VVGEEKVVGEGDKAPGAANSAAAEEGSGGQADEDMISSRRWQLKGVAPAALAAFAIVAGRVSVPDSQDCRSEMSLSSFLPT